MRLSAFITLLLCSMSSQMCGAEGGGLGDGGARAVRGLTLVVDVSDTTTKRVAAGVQTCYRAEAVAMTEGGKLGDGVPKSLQMITRGGQLDGLFESSSDHIALEVGGRYRVFLSGREGECWRLMSAQRLLKAQTSAGKVVSQTSNESGGANGSNVVAGGYSLSAAGVPSRLTASDANLSIGYVIDAEFIPAGLTQAQVVTAVDNAFDAWEAVCALRFHRAGVQNLGQSARSLPQQDGRIYIQTHDTYDPIAANNGTLGIGGAASSFSAELASAGGEGGTIDGRSYHPIIRGFVVLDHEKPRLQILEDFEEVLTHEIGHTLGLAHSSEDENEANAVLRDAIMYYRISNSGRGASLTTYDIDCIRVAYDPANSAPFAHNTLLRAVSPDTGVNGANQVIVHMGHRSLAENQLSLELLSGASGPGSETVSGNVIRYLAPNASAAPVPDALVGQQFYRQRRYVIRDANDNLSPIYNLQVHAFDRDEQTVGDGVPSTWSQANFGTGTISPTGDPDADGINNLLEYQLGLNPNSRDDLVVTNDFADGNISISFPAPKFASYRLESSADLITWDLLASGLALTEQVTVAGLPATASDLYYRVVYTP